MSSFKNSKIFKGIKKLFTDKLFLFSLSLYILIPITFLVVKNIDCDYRTAGIYVCYENNKLSAKIILQKDNKAIVENYNPDAKNDDEVVHIDKIVQWEYRVSSWSDNFDPEKYHYLSKEYILLENEENTTHVAFFKIGKNFYSSYLIPEERGGGQKCYIKV